MDSLTTRTACPRWQPRAADTRAFSFIQHARRPCPAPSGAAGAAGRGTRNGTDVLHATHPHTNRGRVQRHQPPAAKRETDLRPSVVGPCSRGAVAAADAGHAYRSFSVIMTCLPRTVLPQCWLNVCASMVKTSAKCLNLTLQLLALVLRHQLPGGHPVQQLGVRHGEWPCDLPFLSLRQCAMAKASWCTTRLVAVWPTFLVCGVVHSGKARCDANS